MANPTFATEQLLELMIQLKKTTPDAARQILNSQPQIAYALMTLMVNMNAVNIQVFQKTLADFASKSATPAGPTPIATPTPTAPPIAAAPVIPTAQPQPQHPSYPSSSAAASAVPAHLQNQYQQQYRTSATPPSAPSSVPPPAAAAAASGGYPPSYPNANGYGANGQQYPGYGGPAQAQAQPGYYGQPQQPQQQQQYPGYGYPSNPQSAGGPGYGHAQGGPAPPSAAAVLASLPQSIQDTLAAMPEEQKALLMRVVTMTPEQIHALPPNERQTHVQLRATLGLPT